MEITEPRKAHHAPAEQKPCSRGPMDLLRTDLPWPILGAERQLKGAEARACSTVGRRQMETGPEQASAAELSEGGAG